MKLIALILKALIWGFFDYTVVFGFVGLAMRALSLLIGLHVTLKTIALVSAIVWAFMCLYRYARDKGV